MSAKRTIIESDLNSVLQNRSFDNFTVIQLRDEYLKCLDKPINPKEARQFVYGQILRFLRLGLLKKAVAVNSRESTYTKTKKFFSTQFKSRSVQAEMISASPKPIMTQNNLANIEEQLKQYQIDFMASVGESEEYMRLYKSNPEFKILLESEYLQARDQSSKLLGQIKALKTVLVHYSN